MRITERQLRKIIRESIARSLHETEVLCRRPGPHGTPRARDAIRPRLRLSEDYVVRVLGFDRRLLAESARDPVLERDILREHLIFEGFWSDAKEKILDKINPIKSSVDAVKRLGNGIDGVVTALTGIANSGGDSIETVLAGATSLGSKNIKAIVKDLNRLRKRFEEIVSKLGDSVKSGAEKIVEKLSEFIKNFSNKIWSLTSDSKGWKRMMGVLVVYLGTSAVRDKIGMFVNTSLEILSGNSKDFLSRAKILRNQVGDTLDLADNIEAPVGTGADKSDETSSALEAIFAGVWGLAWGFIKKAALAAGGEAAEQLGGPVAWLKKLAKIFEWVAGGMAWICEQITSAIERATFKPLSLAGPSP